ncbi:uncharacterized protein LOC123538687 [Mercenaria mercenaria]|uniref:uncharacterized protein LOC123538687 n=1 Tax=Mercenaria mercenaria TaxID=6596 RepID=UPI00234F4EA6|nr:uncharacterized protein LOC123538687 [Mercenaria mercenaria]
MATSGKHDDSETETTIDVSGFMRAFTNDDDGEDADTSTERSGDISMFCKACLHPYCGEQKAGTIVLRCERCGQTDTVLEERVGSLKPQEWIGNLMMNRFMQVVKEQEDISANLSDPLFAEDEYQRISLCLSEYTFNIEKIAVHFYDIAKKARLATEEDRKRIEACQEVDASVAGLEEVQAMNATKTLIEIHKTLVMSNPIPDIDEETLVNAGEDISTGSASHADQQTDQSVENEVKSTDGEKASQDGYSSEIQNTKTKRDQHQGTTTITFDEDVNRNKEKKKRVLELVREQLSQLGPNVLSLIETLISKYNIPDDIMVAVQERLRNVDKAENCENTDVESDSETDLDTKDTKDNQNDGAESAYEEENTEKESKDEDRVSDDNTDSDGGTEESSTIFNIPTETIQKEVFEALGHKLKLRFDSGAIRKINLDQTDDSCPKFQTKEEKTENNETDGRKTTTSQEMAENFDKKSETPIENTSREESANPGENSNENVDNENDTESFMVNFYSLSSEFIRELQRRKSRALGVRKDKALANIHEKIQRLKKEMEGVEEAVTEELTLAYQRKMKKVEKQRKQLDEKHDQVKEAERLLEYYTMTGQEDKIAELIEQFNIQYEN